MKNKRVLALVLCMVLLVAGSVFGTYAYLTDSEAVVNTFTVGKVAITLDEAKVNKDGTEIVGADRVQNNEYHLIPGKTYTKDPTIHVAADSENCWLFVLVENEIADIEGETTIAAQMAENGWEVLDADKGVYFYEEIASAGDDVKVFERFIIAGDGVGNDRIADYEGKSIKVTAGAVQAAGFDTAEEAWDAVHSTEVIE